MKYFMRFNFKKESLYKNLKVTLAVLAFSVVVSQFALLNKTFRKYMTSVDILDGTISVNGDVINENGYVTLNLLKGEPSKDIIILVNGDEYARFTKREIKIEFNKQSVIEVLNKTNNSISVTTGEFSDNVSSTFNNGVVSVEDIAVITRVVLK